MTDAQVLQIVGGALVIATKLAAPILLATLVIGVVVSVFQAVTQIQEQTLSFIPKIVGLAVVLVVGGPWMLGQLISWTQELYGQIPNLVGG